MGVIPKYTLYFRSTKCTGERPTARCERSCVLVSRENRVPAHSDVVLREALVVATTRLPGSSPTDFIWMVMQPWHGSRLAHLKWAYLPHSDSLP